MIFAIGRNFVMHICLMMGKHPVCIECIGMYQFVVVFLQIKAMWVSWIGGGKREPMMYCPRPSVA